MKGSLTATLVYREKQQMFDPKERAKLNGMTEWFLPREIDEMQARLFRDFLDFIMRTGRGGAK